MAFTGQNAVFDIRGVADRIITEIQTRFADAAAFIGVPDLPPIAIYYRSSAGRLQTISPCLMVIEKGSVTTMGDHLAGPVGILFQLFVDGPDTDQLVTDVAEYALLLELILANLPHDVFAAGQIGTETGRHQNFYLETIVTDYDQLRGAPGGNADAFRQYLKMQTVFQVKGRPNL